MNAATMEYGRLLSQTKPEVIGGGRRHRHYVEQLEKLTAQKTVTRAEKKLIRLLTVLVEDYESRNCAVPDASPVGVIRHLLDSRRLRQKDLVDVFGTESIVSDVLNGKRGLTREHIRLLSRRFRVSPSVFFSI